MQFWKKKLYDIGRMLYTQYSPTLECFLPSFILIGCAKIWYFFPAYRNKAVLWSDGFESVGTPRILCWPFTIFAIAGSSVLQKSLKKYDANTQMKSVYAVLVLNSTSAKIRVDNKPQIDRNSISKSRSSQYDLTIGSGHRITISDDFPYRCINFITSTSWCRCACVCQ